MAAVWQPVVETTVQSYSEESLPSLFGTDRSFSSEDSNILPIEREDLPGRPVCAVPVVSVEGLAPADHVVLETSQEPCRPCYQSGLVVEIDVQKGRMLLIRYKKEGVSKEWVLFEAFELVYIVQYTLCRYSQEEAISRAEHRVRWEESLYHALFNNSHHLVTWAKTGREYPLTDIIKELEYLGDTHLLDPTLTKEVVPQLVDLEPGDHIVTNSEHQLVQSIDLEKQEYTAFTWNGRKAAQKQFQWNADSKMFRLDYDPHSSPYQPETSIKNADSEAHIAFSSSDEFVTMMKTGKKYAIGDSCIFAHSTGPVSYTPVNANVAVDEGDHLVLKDAEGKFHPVLLYKYIGEGVVVTMPDISTTAAYGQVHLTDFDKVYRINYQESLPVDAVLKRACSQTGEFLLRECGPENADKFVSWAKTGQMWEGGITKLQQENSPQVSIIRPWEREKILSILEINPGDHLIQRTSGHWFHFMATETNTDPTDVYNTGVIYCFRGVIREKMIHINPTKDDIYRICYPECLSTDVAIERARSKLGLVKLSPLARMWFVRWAKTGSDEGIEVDFLANKAVPVTKSRIMSFAQLSPGDYLVERKHFFSRWHHYLVTETQSPTLCSAIQSWGSPTPDMVAELQLTLSESSTYYHLNYSSGACIAPELAINNARAKLGTSFTAGSNYTRQRFVNFIKTRCAEIISVDDIFDERLFLPRETIHSLQSLKPGDHIECPMVNLLGKTTIENMFVVSVIDRRRCSVLTGNMQEEEVCVFNGSQDVFRVSYPERVPPLTCVPFLREVEDVGMRIDSAMTNGTMSRKAEATSVGEAVYGDSETSIQVHPKLHDVLQYNRAEILKPIAVALRTTGTRSMLRELVGVRHSVRREVRNTTPEVALTTDLKFAFNVGRRVALGTAMVFRGPAVGLFVLVEAPLLARGMYKLYRKKQFDHISKADYKREVIRESFTSANVVIGATGGAVVGQLLIPVPGLGAGIGGAIGAVAGQIAGKAEGYAFAKLVQEKAVSLPTIVSYNYTEINNCT